MSLADPSVKMSKSLGERHVLYLFDENFHKKLQKADSTPAGIDNLRKIGSFFGIEKTESNSEYKNTLAIKLAKFFQGV